MTDQSAINTLRRRRDAAAWALLTVVRSYCPGEHAPRQHRDGNPPWCRACGRTADGVRVQEVES